MKNMIMTMGVMILFCLLIKFQAVFNVLLLQKM